MFAGHLLSICADLEVQTRCSSQSTAWALDDTHLQVCTSRSVLLEATGARSPWCEPHTVRGEAPMWGCTATKISPPLGEHHRKETGRSLCLKA